MKRTIIGFLLAALMVSAACGRQDAANGKDTDKVFPVEVGTVKQVEWVDEITTYGTVKAPDKVDIFPRISGKLVSLLAKEEQAVQVGQVVAVMERDEIGLNFKPQEIKSTVAGRVESVYFKEGAKVNEMSPLMSVSRMTELKLVVNLFETDLSRVKPGQESIITLDALPDKQFRGKVSLVKPTLDALSSKGEVEIMLDGNYPEIMSGMFGRAGIITGRRTALTITPEAFKKVSGKNAVYVVENNLARLAFIEIGSQKPDMIEVRSGLSAGQTVITFVSDEIKDGASVKILGAQK
ncbi:MAG: efflux RND transporter periplasmic adaptor subunit [Candidatus Brocadiia bacterium]